MSITVQKTTQKSKIKKPFECILTKDEIESFSKYYQRKYLRLTEEEYKSISSYWEKRLSHMDNNYIICNLSKNSDSSIPLVLMNNDFYDSYHSIHCDLCSYLILSNFTNNIDKGIKSFWIKDDYENILSDLYKRYNNLWYIKDFEPTYEIEKLIEKISKSKIKIKSQCSLKNFIAFFNVYSAKYIKEHSVHHSFIENIKLNEDIVKTIDSQINCSLFFANSEQPFQTMKYLIYKILKENNYNVGKKEIDTLLSSSIYKMIH